MENLAQIPLFQSCDPEVLNSFLAATPNSIRTYHEGDFIALQGDPCKSLYVLYKGRIKAHMTNEKGKQLVVDMITAPQILAPAFIYSSKNRFPVNIEATEESSVICIDKNRFLRFMGENIGVMEAFIRDISDRALFLSQKLNEFALQGLKERLITYLKLHKTIRRQHEVAAVMGVERPSLARALSELQSEGRIRIIDKSIEIIE